MAGETAITHKVIIRLDWDEEIRDAYGRIKGGPCWAELPFVDYDGAQRKLDEIVGGTSQFLTIPQQSIFFLDAAGVKKACVNTEPYKKLLSGLDAIYVHKSRLRRIGIANAQFVPWK